MIVSRRKPTKLKPYKTLYRGRRLWAVQNSKENPLDEWTGENDIVVWDASVDAVTAVGKYKDDGSIYGEIVWGQGVDFVVKDVRGMIAYVVWLEKEYV